MNYLFGLEENELRDYIFKADTFLKFYLKWNQE